MIKEGQAGAGSQLQRLSARYIEKRGERGNNDGFMIDYPEYIIDVVESAAARAGKEYDLKSLRWLNPTETTTAVPDHTYVMQIDGVRSADDAVLIISNETIRMWLPLPLHKLAPLTSASRRRHKKEY